MDECFVVFVKTKRSKKWSPLSVWSRQSYAKEACRKAQRAWPYMDLKWSRCKEK